ncbi:class I SAM-dependent methyltransferase [Williamsia sp. CHRR-6]|uniref:class I SAM-dependent methyltransferase n=1 Tax=Williamsia sp. CHRR-6 TaxID=2835871 RepID=UPI001BDB51A6|nr:class I SAM-dependent methyltransferase [Williamsia sp. CHRR-6]MBT0567384.1 methyltransferase domain-containing protein [Williamsia sp. CHRR-6]
MTAAQPAPTPSAVGREWSTGRYDAVAARIFDIAVELVASVEDRLPLSAVRTIDLACGTGNAAFALAEVGATDITGLDISPELIAVAQQKSRVSPHDTDITWVIGDAADTGLPAESFDAAVSSMGLIFVEPVSQVAELVRLLRPGGTLGFSAWMKPSHNPFHDPVATVLGTSPPGAFAPEQWGEPETVRARLAEDFDTVEIEHRVHTWAFDTAESAMHFLTSESPYHVDLLRRCDEMERERLVAGFEAALAPHTDGSGRVAFDAPYLIVTARRR